MLLSVVNAIIVGLTMLNERCGSLTMKGYTDGLNHKEHIFKMVDKATKIKNKRMMAIEKDVADMLDESKKYNRETHSEVIRRLLDKKKGGQE